MSQGTQTWRGVRNRIHTAILNGVYAPGAKLPRDADLAAEMRCARSTVQRAMQSLSQRGIVERRRKRGTRVCLQPATKATLDIPITRDEVESRGSQYGYQLIRRSTEKTPLAVAGVLGLPQPTAMLRVRALHLADGRPYILEDRWISTRTVPEILTVDLASVSANEWLVRNRPISDCSIRLYAEAADEERAQYLDCRLKDALFIVDRSTWIGKLPITSVKASCAPGYRLLTRI